MNTIVREIRKTTDATGKEVVVKYCDFVAQGPKELVKLFYDTTSELISKGYSESAIVINNKCKAIYIEIDGVVVSHIIFDYYPNMLRTWIVLSAVHPDYRRRGLYKIMHEDFENASRKLGAVEIGSYVHINNIARQESAKQVGFLPSHYLMRKRID